jgi:hypothetical protein
MRSKSDSTSGSSARRAGRLCALAAAAALTVLSAGCQYGYSRTALQGEAYAPASSYVGLGYGMAWGASPSYFAVSYRYAYPYAYPYYPYPYYSAYDPWWYPPPYAYYYDPWWYYPSSYYYYPYYRYPVYSVPAPRRTFRLDSGSGTSTPPPSSSTAPKSSGRRFNTR